MAQLPETAQHPDMPGSAVETGLVDRVLPIEEMGEALAQYIDRLTLWQPEPSVPPAEDIQILREITALLSARGGGDFRGYKEGMLMRRTQRRMALRGFMGLDAYVTYLRDNSDTDEPLFVSGDPIRLTQIVENLLTNAAKFTEEGGEISLDVRHEGHELVMAVRDNGIGIPQRMLSKIF